MNNIFFTNLIQNLFIAAIGGFLTWLIGFLIKKYNRYRLEKNTPLQGII